jgi:hypothetical protein
MPTITRTIAKGVPPRPKPKGNPRTQNNTIGKVKAKETGNRKRTSRNDDSDSEDNDISDDSAIQAKTKKNGKRRRTQPEVEPEVVDEDVDPPENVVENVEDVEDNVEPPNEQDVSTSFISWTLKTYYTLGGRSKQPSAWGRTPRKAHKKRLNT